METRTVFDIANKPKTRIEGDQGKNLTFINNIRWLLTIFVVMIHLHVTYSGMGLWYYREPGSMGPLSFWSFIMYQAISQAYVLGLFFFIAGYFTPGSYNKRGYGRFIRDRFIRLGIPTLLYMLVIHPVTVLITSHFNKAMPTNLVSWYGQYITSMAFLSNSGPMWFTFALFVFAVAYALFRYFSGSTATPIDKQTVLITHGRVIAVIVFISAAAFMLRTVQPAGVPLLNNEIGNFMQIGFFAQYVIAFILGIFAYLHNLIDRLTYRLGKIWFTLAVVLGLPFLPALFIGGGIAKRDPANFFGGFHWQSAAYATWESFIFVGISLGMLTMFRKINNTQGPVRRFLSENAFGVYVFHAPILVTLSMLFMQIELPPLGKMYLMTLIVLPACFGFSYVLKKVPLFKKLFA